MSFSDFKNEDNKVALAMDLKKEKKNNETMTFEFKHDNYGKPTSNYIWFSSYGKELGIGINIRTHCSVEGRLDERLTLEQVKKLRRLLSSHISKLEKSSIK